MSVYESLVDRASQEKAMKETGQMSLFDMVGQSAPADEFPNIDEYSLKENWPKKRSFGSVYHGASFGRI